MTARPPLHPAPAELAHLAATTRPDLTADDVLGAIQACQAAGWHWAKVMTAVIVMCNRGEHPDDLRAAARKVTAHTRIT